MVQLNIYSGSAWGPARRYRRDGSAWVALAGAPPGGSWDGVDTTPYAMPSAPPWTVPLSQYTIIPTPDGTGSATHPDVVDFKASHGLDSWNGYRYWMGVTPYYMSDPGQELPNIYASHDGFTWVTPPGLANPVYRAQNVRGTGSDTDLVYDPSTGRLCLFWREYLNLSTSDEIIYVATSSDGSTWTGPVKIIEVQGAQHHLLSPAIVRVGPGDWRMWATQDLVMNDQSTEPYGMSLYTAPAATGPWTKTARMTFTGDIGTARAWHLDVIRAGAEFHMLLNCKWNLRPARSVDGINWTLGPAFLSQSTDLDFPYRSTIQPHENGVDYRLWYASNTDEFSWRVWYSKVPRSLWDSLTA